MSDDINDFKKTQAYAVDEGVGPANPKITTYTKVNPDGSDMARATSTPMDKFATPTVSAYATDAS